jgi:hypothetical protein
VDASKQRNNRFAAGVPGKAAGAMLNKNLRKSRRYWIFCIFVFSKKEMGQVE